LQGFHKGFFGGHFHIEISSTAGLPGNPGLIGNYGSERGASRAR